MSTIEIIAVLFSLLCVTLTVRKKAAAWPIGIIGVLAYMVLFRQERLYADMGLQVVFLIQGFYGWWLWGTKGAGEDDFSDVRTLSQSHRIVVGIALLTITLVLGTALHAATDASLPYLDSFLATMSLTANLMLARKIVENWILWIVADVFYVGLFLFKGLYLSSGLYLVFLALAISGYRQWTAGMKRRVATATPL